MSLTTEEMWEVILNDPELTEKLRRRIKFLREKLSAPSITIEGCNIESISKDIVSLPVAGTGSIPPVAKKVKPSEKKREKVPENVDAVIEYGVEIRLPKVECERFYDHFTANGWKVSGKSPMQDWKASLRNWLRTWREKGGLNPDPTPKPKIHRMLDIEDEPVVEHNPDRIFGKLLGKWNLPGGE